MNKVLKNSMNNPSPYYWWSKRKTQSSTSARPVRGICLPALIAILSSARGLYAADSCSTCVSSPVCWLLCLVVLYLVFLHIRNCFHIKSLLRTKTAIASLPIQCGVCDEQGRIFFYKDSNGLKRDDDPKTIHDLNVELRQELENILPSIFETNTRRSIEFNSFSTQYKIDFSPLPKSDYGVPTVLWIVHDVSDLTKAFDERMQMFRLLQNTLSSIDDAVISTNCDGEITLINPSATRIAGVPKSDMMGKLLDDFFLLQDEQGESLVKKVILTRNSFPFHADLKINGQGTIFVDGLIAPIIEEQLIVGTVLYFHDTTELVKQEQKLQLALKFAQTSDRVKSDFLAAVCHEFRSSINVIIGYCDLNTVDKKGQRDPNIENIHNEAEKLLYMFNDILDISKNNTEATGTALEPVNLNVFTREMQRIFSRTSVVKKVPLVVQIEPKVPVILSDYKGLRQVFMQLLTQAYSIVQGDSVVMTINLVDRDLFIEIQIDSPKMRFNQDLSIFDRLCERLNGVLNFEQSSKSLKFELCLKHPKVVCETTTTTLPDLAHLKSRPKRDVILLVDDISINLKLLAAMLKRLNIESVSCTTAREAMEEISKYEPMAIFMDLWMPDIGGEELAKTLDMNPETASIPRILTTADTQLDPQLKKLFMQVIYKPLNSNDLTNVVNLIEQNKLDDNSTLGNG